ncbi:unnamed protein product [Amoebophrya sp. A120]|nr:unnamed protein product [Amoebophrya sp. A120]|eukprot:GSA120T00003674001.1
MNVVQFTTATAQPAQILVLQAPPPTLLCEDNATAPVVTKQEQDQTSEDPPASPITTKSTGRVGGILARAKGQKAESTNTPTATPKSTGRVGGLVARAKRAGVGATSSAAARAKQVKGIFLAPVSSSFQKTETSHTTASPPAKPVKMMKRGRTRVLREIDNFWNLIQVEGAVENPGDPAPRAQYNTPPATLIFVLIPLFWPLLGPMVMRVRALQNALPMDAMLCDQADLELVYKALRGTWFLESERGPGAGYYGAIRPTVTLTINGVTAERQAEFLMENGPVRGPKRAQFFQFARAASKPNVLFTDAFGSHLLTKIDAANPSPVEIELATNSLMASGDQTTFSKWVRKNPNAAS